MRARRPRAHSGSIASSSSSACAATSSTCAARAPVVDQAVVRDPVQPGRELRCRRVRRAGADHVHPHVLEHLVRGAGVAAMAQQIAVAAALVARVQRVEGGGVARGVGEHQRLVAGKRMGCAGIARSIERPSRVATGVSRRVDRRRLRHARSAHGPPIADTPGAGRPSAVARGPRGFGPAIDPAISRHPLTAEDPARSAARPGTASAAAARTRPAGAARPSRSGSRAGRSGW